MALIEACVIGDVDLVSKILSDLDVNINDEDDKGRRPLGEALKNRKNQIAKLLIEDPRTDVNLESWVGEEHRVLKSYLQIALDTENMEMLYLLIQNPNIDFNSTGRGGKNFLHYVCTTDNVDILKHLLKDKRVNPTIQTTRFDNTCFHLASMHNRCNMIRLLIEDGRIDPNHKDSQSKTALHYACSTGRVDITSCLLSDSRTDPNATDTYGLTALTQTISRVDIIQNIPAILRVMLTDERVELPIELAREYAEMTSRNIEIMIEVVLLMCTLRNLDPTEILQNEKSEYIPLVLQKIQRSRMKSARK